MAPIVLRFLLLFLLANKIAAADEQDKETKVIDGLITFVVKLWRRFTKFKLRIPSLEAQKSDQVFWMASPLLNKFNDDSSQK